MKRIIKGMLSVLILSQLVYADKTRPAKKMTKDEILSVIKNGSSGQNYPMGAMPSGMAGGKDAEKIATWLSNNMEGDTPKAFGICAGCHGADGKGMNGMTPDLSNLKKVIDKKSSVEDAKRLCDNEIKKEQPSINVLEKQCGIVTKQYEEKKEYKEAIKYLLKIISIQEKLELQSNLVIADKKYNLGIDYYYSKEYNQSIKVLSEVEKIYNSAKEKRKSLGSLYHWLGDNYNKLNESRKSQQFYNKALVMKKLYNSSDKESIDLTKKAIKDTESKSWNKLSELVQKKEKMSIKKMIDGCGMVELFEQYNKAKQCYLEVFSKVKDDNNVTSESILLIYKKLGDMESKLKNYKEALSIYNEALDYCKKTVPKNDKSIAEIYISIGTVYLNLKQYEKSIKYLKKSITIYEKITSNIDISKVVKKKNLAGTLADIFAKGDKTILDDRESLDIYLNLALAYNIGGNAYLHINDYKNSEKLFEKSLFIRKTLLPPDDKKVQESYSHLIKLNKKLGNKKKIELYSNTLKKIKDKKFIDSANMYEGMGLNNLAIADYESSLMYIKGAYKIRKENLQDRPLELVKSYDSLFMVYTSLGNDIEAEKYAKKSLEVRKKILGEKHKDTAISYYNMASVLAGKEDFNEALKLFIKAMNIIETNDKNNKELGSLYSAIGTMYLMLNKDKEALLYMKKGLDFNENSLTKAVSTTDNNNTLLLKPIANISNVSVSYIALSNLSFKLSHFDDALQYLKKALELNKLIYVNNHPDTGFIYNDFANIYVALNNYPKAYSYAKKSYDAFIINRDKNFQILSNKQKKLYLKSNSGKIPLLLETAYLYGKEEKANERVKLSKTTLSDWLNYKGAIYDSENAIVALYESTKDKALKAEIDELMQSKRNLARLYQTLPKSKEERATYQTRIAQSRKAIDELEKKISAKASSFKEELGLRDINYKDIAKNLKENELYVDYAKAGEYYYIFTLDAKENITFKQIDENATKSIDENVKLFREDIDKVLKGSKLTQEEMNKLQEHSKTILSKLYTKALSEPLKEILPNYSSLIVSADGALRLLPFETMFNAKSNKYLIEEKNIRYIPSGKELVRLFRSHNKNPKEKVVLFDNPNFDAKDVVAVQTETLNTPNTENRAGIIKSLFKMRFSKLLGTKKEAIGIKETLKGQEIQEFSQNQASEANLLKLESPKILHIATHGFFINDSSIPNPMLKSGIALSGANASAMRGKSDGIVTSLKLSGLHLKGTQLVVLSACQTGVVDINSTDNVSGLNKAFIQAGAKNIIMSLWSVSDNETSKLMNDFYKNTQQNADYANALRKAKLKMIEEKLHPFYWGAFIVSGV